MSVPTVGDEFAKLTYHLRMAQEASAMIAHLYNAEEGSVSKSVAAKNWLRISENLKEFIQHVVKMGMRRSH